MGVSNISKERVKQVEKGRGCWSAEKNEGQRVESQALALLTPAEGMLAHGPVRHLGRSISILSQVSLARCH